jgi:hypothetical protein
MSKKPSTWTDELGRKRVTCKRCGTHSLIWRTSKNGKTYLADPDVIYPVSRVPATHFCDPLIVESYQKEVADRAMSHEAALEAALANGEIVKGQTVEVVKGRKVAIGTVGIVFWVADAPDRFDVVKLGFTTAAGEKHFINIENVRVAAKAGA